MSASILQGWRVWPSRPSVDVATRAFSDTVVAVESLPALVAHHGYWIVAAAIGIESMGLPVPGETMLVAAAVYAGATHQVDIVAVITAAIIGAIVGDGAGFLIGRRFGHALLLRYGGAVGMTPARIKLGQYLFLRYGGGVVFFGRFIALLRALAAVLAGTNCMAWPRFVVYNVAGAIVWAGGYGTLAYLFGERMERVTRAVGIVAVVGAVLIGLAMMRFLKHHEAQLEEAAERALPGPLR
jgi:membrane protein DedA with SNARE-associated domain